MTLHDLVRQALRMRPDRLVVGEVRGAEVVDLLAALNTGHEGGCATIHANTPADVPARLEALACAAGLSRDAVHSQLAAALDVVIHLVRSAGRRRVSEICVFERGHDGLVNVIPAVSYAADGHTTKAPGMTAPRPPPHRSPTMIDANARTAQRRWTADTRGRLRTYGHRTSGTVDIGTPPDKRSHTIVHDNGPPPTEKPGIRCANALGTRSPTMLKRRPKACTPSAVSARPPTPDHRLTDGRTRSSIAAAPAR